MKYLLFLPLCLGCGVLLCRWIELLRPAGVELNVYYLWLLLGTDFEVAARQCLSFIYLGFFYLGCAALLFESAKSWVRILSKSSVVYFFRSAAFFVACVLILEMVGLGGQSVHTLHFANNSRFWLFVCFLVVGHASKGFCFRQYLIWA